MTAAGREAMPSDPWAADDATMRVLREGWGIRDVLRTFEDEPERLRTAIATLDPDSLRSMTFAVIFDDLIEVSVRRNRRSRRWRPWRWRPWKRIRGEGWW